MWTAKRFFSIIMDTRNGDVSYKLSVGLFITNKMGQQSPGLSLFCIEGKHAMVMMSCFTTDTLTDLHSELINLPFIDKFK